MVCPECRSEYRPDFAECADCRVPLVDELPEPSPPAEVEPEARRWELNRRDSLNIAFIRGAVVGYACGGALNILGMSLASRLVIPLAFSPGPWPLWLESVQIAVQILPYFGIVLGGYLGLRWSR